MRIDAAGMTLITSYEGCRLTAYWDKTGKTWTIGYGHTATAREGMKISKAQAVTLLYNDIKRFEQCVEENVKSPLNQGQFNALVSFAFNLGCGGFRRSSILEAVNEGRTDEAVRAFGKYTKSGGRQLAGLVKRRKDESKMYASGSVTRRGPDFAGAFQWVFGGSIQQLFSKG